MADEMRHHVDLQTELNLKAGMDPDEARYATLRQFGNVTVIQERARAVRSWVWLEQLGQDVRYGWRQLRKAPGFAGGAVLTLAIGIGATTSIFSVVNSVLLRPLDYSEADRLVFLQATYQDQRPGWISYEDYLHLSEQVSSFSGVAAFAASHPITSNFTGAGEPERVNGLRISTNYFSTLGVRPDIGRDFHSEEASTDKANVMILSHRLWMKKFAGRPDVINQTVGFNDQFFMIVGILPSNRQLDVGSGCFIPLTMLSSDGNSSARQDQVEVIARLKPRITLAQATSEMSVLANALAALDPMRKKGWGIKLVPPLDEILEHSVYGMSGVTSLLVIILSAVSFLLLIACVNVANLLLARANTRRKEIALRASLGASRARIMRQLFCESLLLATLGGGLGLLLAYWSKGLLTPLQSSLPRAGEISIDGHALVFSGIVTLCTGIVFGFVPAMQAANLNLIETLKAGGKTSEGRKSRQLRGLLVVTEVALSFVLLIGAGLLINSFVRLQQVDLGFRTDGIYANRIELPAKKYGNPPQQIAFVNELVQRVSVLPQVHSVAFASGMPIFGGGGIGFTIAGRPENATGPVATALYSAVTPGYFKTLGISVLRGRSFLDSDDGGGSGVVLISKILASRYFPNENPVGKRIKLTNDPEAWREIAGVVGDVRQWGPASDNIRPATGHVYEPFAQKPAVSNLLLVVQSAGDGSELPLALRPIIQSVDRDLPLSIMYRLTDGVAASVARYRLSMVIFAFFSGTALLLAAIGIFGVISYSVAQRTGEIGIRTALGAQREDVMRLIFGNAARLIGPGLLLGLAGAVATTRLLKSLLFEINNYDPLTFLAVTALLLSVAFLACWLPARRAAKVDPVIALRAE